MLSQFWNKNVERMRLSNKFSNWKIKTWHTNCTFTFLVISVVRKMTTFTWLLQNHYLYLYVDGEGRKTSWWRSIRCPETHKTVTICSLLAVCQNQSQISCNKIIPSFPRPWFNRHPRPNGQNFMVRSAFVQWRPQQMTWCNKICRG